MLGRGAAGYALLAAGLEPGERGGVVRGGDDVVAVGSAAPGTAAWAVEGFLAPEPPLAAGPAGAAAGATAMMDVSDGLVRDAGRIARASGVVVDLDDPYAWPDLDLLLAPAEAVGARDAAAPTGAPDVRRTALSWLLTGGEDHGILATFPADAALPAGFRRLGVVRTAGTAGTVGTAAGEGAGPGPRDGATAPGVLVDGRDPADLGIDAGGWDHFAGG